MNSEQIELAKIALKKAVKSSMSVKIAKFTDEFRALTKVEGKDAWYMPDGTTETTNKSESLMAWLLTVDFILHPIKVRKSRLTIYTV